MSVRRTIRRAWEAYRLLRVASYAAGALAGAGGLAGAYWTLLARRLRAGLAEDSPEYAADTAVDPWHAGERAAGLARAAHFSWAHTATATAEVYRDALAVSGQGGSG